jgi:hypothetical protein
MDLTTIKVDKKIQKLFKKHNLKPLFVYRGSMVYYAQSQKDKSIHIVNSNLLRFLLEQKDSPQYKAADFSTKITKDIGRFIALYNRGLLYERYYANYDKVINRSGFDVKKFEQDVYARPVVFIYDREKQKFFQTHSDQTPRVVVKKGSNINLYLKIILKKLKLKEKLLMAEVGSEIEYEKNDKDYLMPRLNITLFTN